MDKPDGCTYPNCLICPLPDCQYDGYEDDMKCECEYASKYYEENRQRICEHLKKYNQRPDVKARKRELQRVYRTTERYKKWRREYIKRPEVVERRNKRKRELYALKKENKDG